MRNIQKYLAALMIAALIPVSVNADNLSQLPQAWQQRLVVVAEPDLSKLTEEEKKRTTDIRQQISTYLGSPSTDDKAIASLYGDLGVIYQAINLATHSEHCYINANVLDPGEFRWAYYLAYLTHNNGDLQKALQRYKKADRIKPGYVPLQYRVAEIYLELNQLDKAETIFKELLKQKEMAAEANAGLGQIAYLKHDHDNAIKYLERALELQPEAASLNYQLGQAYRSKGDMEKARQHLKKFKDLELVVYDPMVHELETKLTPSLMIFVDAMKAVQRKDYGEAIEHFSKGLELFPSNASARTSYARALYLNGDKEAARKQLERALQQMPDKTMTLFLLAVLDDAAGNTEQALKRYNRVIEQMPDHEGAHFYLGNHYLSTQDYQSAVRHYDASLSGGSKNKLAVIYRLVASVAQASSQREVAGLLMEVNHKRPGIYPLMRLQILVLALSKEARDLDTARMLAEKMVQQQPAPGNIELLAITYAAEGRFDEANRQIERVNAMLAQMPYAGGKKLQSPFTRLFREQRLPPLNMEREIRRLMPPATDPVVAFRDYPDPRPVM